MYGQKQGCHFLFTVFTWKMTELEDLVGPSLPNPIRLYYDSEPEKNNVFYLRKKKKNQHMICRWCHMKCVVQKFSIFIL